MASWDVGVRHSKPPGRRLEAPATTWRKSTRSGSDGEHCVEAAAFLKSGVAIRDSKDPDGGRLRVGASEWSGLLASIKARQA
ncbi:hypothetical protein FHU30_006119 [Actinomadura rupiterrae]|nr:hypothetical protein [Actinomadura rupiterrae]